LADARPAGKLQTDRPHLQVFAFHAKPDGSERLVLVGWADKEIAPLRLPQKPVAIFDLLGRAMPPETELNIGSAPWFIVLEKESKTALSLQPPPEAPPRLAGEPSPLVLQLLLPRKRVLLEESAYRIASGKVERLSIFLYNFGPQDVDCRPTVKGPADWQLQLPEKASVSAGGRTEMSLELTPPEKAEAMQTILIEADCGAAGRSLLSFRLKPEQ